MTIARLLHWNEYYDECNFTIWQNLYTHILIFKYVKNESKQQGKLYSWKNDKTVMYPWHQFW